MVSAIGDPRIGPLPNFIVIGAAKSGTTTLYNYLDSHPCIAMSAIKEPCFFDHNVSWEKGWDWYRKLFAHAQQFQICGEASTNYTRFPQVTGVPEKIANYMPDIKLIYIIRDPVERAYSHYVHRHVKELFPGKPFRQGFEEFVANDPMCIDSSDYLMQIKQYLRYFSKEQLLVIRFDDLVKSAETVLTQVFLFLSVDPNCGAKRGGRSAFKQCSYFS